MSEWVVQDAKKQTEPIPEATYNGVFKGIVETEYKGEPKWRFVWTVKSGEHQGKEASAFTDRIINPNTLTGQLISGLLGRKLDAGENVKPAVVGCIGQTYLVVVRAGPKGGKPMVRVCTKLPSM